MTRFLFYWLKKWKWRRNSKKKKLRIVAFECSLTWNHWIEMCVIFLSSTVVHNFSFDFPLFIPILEFRDEIFDEKQIPSFTNAVSLDCDLIYGMSVLNHSKNGALASAFEQSLCEKRNRKKWRKLLRWNFPTEKNKKKKQFHPEKMRFIRLIRNSIVRANCVLFCCTAHNFLTWM